MSFLVLAGVLWGTGGLLGLLLADATGLSAVAVAAYRLTVGGGLLVAYLVATGRGLPRGRAARRRIAATGALAAVFQACYFSAVSLSSVSLATLVTIGTAPVLVLIAERATGRRTLVTVGLALLGLGLLVGLPTGGQGFTEVLAGSSFAVLAGAGFAALTLLASRPVPGLDPAAATGPAFVLGGLLLLPVAAAGSGLVFAPDAVSVGLLVAFGVLPTALAYTCYFHGLTTTTPTTGSVMALLEPLTAAVLAALLLGDRLGVAGTGGAVLLGAAVVLAGLRGQERARSA
jgi:DME family drug/metabolite transporter